MQLKNKHRLLALRLSQHPFTFGLCLYDKSISRFVNFSFSQQEKILHFNSYRKKLKFTLSRKTNFLCFILCEKNVSTGVIVDSIENYNKFPLNRGILSSIVRTLPHIGNAGEMYFPVERALSSLHGYRIQWHLRISVSKWKNTPPKKNRVRTTEDIDDVDKW